MLTTVGYVFSVILLYLGLKKPGFSLLGAILLTSLAVSENAATAENAVALIAVWVYAFILLLSKLKM
jgi:FtsH-binding integral membrane protein